MLRIKTTEPLPTYIVDTQASKTEENRLRKLVRDAQSAYNRLSATTDIAPLPPLSDLTPEWLEARVEEKLNALQSANFIPDSERGKYNKHWRTILTFGKHHIDRIRALIDEFGINGVTFDEQCNTIVVPYLSERIKKIVKKEIPIVTQEHWKHILRLRKAYKILRQFEEYQCSPKLCFTSLLTIDGSSFARMAINRLEEEEQAKTSRVMARVIEERKMHEANII